jgi:acyl-CoA thioester hydrolase
MHDQAESFSIRRQVEFRDTDAAGIVHFSAFFPMMESAEHAFLRHLGLSVMQALDDGTHVSWPRVAATCDYLGAARFEDILDIHVTVESLGTKSVRYGFDLRRDDQKIARGSLAAVCCVIEHGKELRSIPIPAPIRELLQGYLRT